MECITEKKIKLDEPGSSNLFVCTVMSKLILHALYKKSHN